MNFNDVVSKANEFWGVTISEDTKYSAKAFVPKCLAVLYAIKEQKTPYSEMMQVYKTDRTDLRLMWLYAEGSLGVVKTRREYNEFVKHLTPNSNG